MSKPLFGPAPLDQKHLGRLWLFLASFREFQGHFQEKIRKRFFRITKCSATPKAHPSKPHPCNMPHAKNRSCAAIFGKLHCNIRFSAVRISFLPKAVLQQTTNCTTTMSCHFPSSLKLPHLGSHVGGAAGMLYILGFQAPGKVNLLRTLGPHCPGPCAQFLYGVFSEFTATAFLDWRGKNLLTGFGPGCPERRHVLKFGHTRFNNEHASSKKVLTWTIRRYLYKSSRATLQRE